MEKKEKIYRCKSYNVSSIRCPAFLKINKNEEIVEYNGNHLCIYNEQEI